MWTDCYLVVQEGGGESGPGGGGNAAGDGGGGSGGGCQVPTPPGTPNPIAPTDPTIVPGEPLNVVGGKLVIMDVGGCGTGVVLLAPSAVVQDVKDSLKGCLDSALLAISNPAIKNLITNWYNSMALSPNSPINIEFDEQPNLTGLRNDGSGIIDTLPARTVHLQNSNDYKITINDSYLTYSGYNMSKEAWAQVITHEILHVFISQNQPAVAAQGLDHAFMFKNLINPTRDLLVSAFGITSDDATDLALNGLGDLWQYSDFEALCITNYGRTKSQIYSTKDDYMKKLKGQKCH